LAEIFTDHWQRGVRETETAEMLEGLHFKRFGDRYSEIKAFKNIIKGMTNKAEVVAYLLSD